MTRSKTRRKSRSRVQATISSMLRGQELRQSLHALPPVLKRMQQTLQRMSRLKMTPLPSRSKTRSTKSLTRLTRKSVPPKHREAFLEKSGVRMRNQNGACAWLTVIGQRACCVF
ncbi:hypothetical protein CB0940_03158 [Cercospora beticola]|uniref:Uncharacterized protein n=1 Tax=Cercospora beticola TaxID=122368 RepID=A0A2G5I5R8_CERBT|nr:hypothetical protein CB0940_03158 [Cercospora beticola]PIB00112.1 hypothetical protein CB0940_03158 [Cercospora beticola]